MRNHPALSPTFSVLLLLLVAAACVPSARIHPRAAEEVRRGYGYLGTDDLERAGVAFEHALEFNSDFPEALNGAAIVARRRGEARDARRLLQRALVARPDFAEGLVNLGELDLSEGLDDAAEARFRRALSVDPDLLPARLNLARALLHRGRADAKRRQQLWEAARREYLHLLESSPDLAEAHHDLAFLDFESGRFERAAQGYERAAAADPRYADAHLGACAALARAGRIDEAKAACVSCLAVAPGDARCAQSLGALQARSPSPTLIRAAR
jgi:Tfp pilus assembly protein PilF